MVDKMIEPDIVKKLKTLQKELGRRLTPQELIEVINEPPEVPDEPRYELEEDPAA
jgi:hypothetical protein